MDSSPTKPPPTNQPPTNQPPTNQPPTNPPPTNPPPTNPPPTSNPNTQRSESVSDARFYFNIFMLTASIGAVILGVTELVAYSNKAKTSKLLQTEIIPAKTAVKALGTKSISTIQHLRKQNESFSAIDNRINNLLTRFHAFQLALDDFPIKSCQVSTVFGPRTLQSGTKIYCQEQSYTVIQRNGRTKNTSFSRNWDEYVNGFGDASEDFWVGLENMHLITKDKNCRLRIKALFTEKLSDNKGPLMDIDYSSFSVDSAEDKYKLHLDGLSCVSDQFNAQHDPFRRSSSSFGWDPSDNQPFSTKDRNNAGAGNCPNSQGGVGWWYNTDEEGCGLSNLNRPSGEIKIGTRMVVRVEMMIKCDE